MSVFGRLVPRPRHALPGLGETVDRKQHRRLARGDSLVNSALDGLVIRRVKSCDACLDLGFVQSGIAWHDPPIRDLHHQCRVVAPAIGIDQQPRVAREKRRCPQRPRQVLRHRRGADVVGDMSREIFRGEAEGAIVGRNQIRGVVAENEHATFPAPLDAAKRRRFPLLLPQPSKPLLHLHPLLVLDMNPGGLISASLVLSGRKVSHAVKVVTQLLPNVGVAFASVK